MAIVLCNFSMCIVMSVLIGLLCWRSKIKFLFKFKITIFVGNQLKVRELWKDIEGQQERNSMCVAATETNLLFAAGFIVVFRVWLHFKIIYLTLFK